MVDITLSVHGDNWPKDLKHAANTSRAIALFSNGGAKSNLIFMARSLKKGPFVESDLLEKIDKMNNSGAKKPIKTWSRRSMVTPDFVGHTFLVHNGKSFQSVFVTENMVGHKLGEFSLTRVFKKHGSHTAKVTK